MIDGISYIPSSALLTGIPKVSFKDNRAFAVLDTLGESPRMYSQNSELGFYFNDTRYLAIWEMTLNGIRPVALAHELRFGGNTVVFSMTNRDFEKISGAERIPRDTFLIRRILTLYQDCLFETVEIKNFDRQSHSLQIEQWAGGRFDDVFEVRGYPRARRGKMLSPLETWENDHRITVLQYEGLDNRVRRTFIRRLFPAEKIRLSPALAGYFTRVEIPSKGIVALKTIVSFDHPSDCQFGGRHYGQVSITEKMKALEMESANLPLSSLTFQTDNNIVARAIANAQTDIFMLLTEEPSKILYPYAGIPWFSAPFGRDGIITAYQMLPWYPNLAKGVLDYAFETLGKNHDPFTDEQPGKVFHELRRGEMSETREVPFIPYYGSVDSTPLCLILLHEYICWTLDLEKLREWWPDALRALSWIGSNFLEYYKLSPSGLINQGWKDSHDSIMHADGRLAAAPIKLCEVQAYSFRARMGMAALAKLLGENELAAKLRLEALQFRARFSEEFWDFKEGFAHLALDGKDQPCRVRSSNMGQCLWGQILFPDQAKKIVSHLMSDAMFSGYGIRTLADTEVAYNPLSYHNGSIWPHDNSLIMEGMRNYGFNSDLERLALALIGVLEASDDFRLPELYCGFRKRNEAPPIPYEVACKPQAWAAGAVFLMLKSMLGLSMDVDQNYLVVNSPRLTSKLSWFEVRGLKGRDWELDLVFRRSQGGTKVDVSRKSGSVRVLKVK